MSSQSVMGAHYSSMAENTDRAIQGEANSMCDMREHMHIKQAANNHFEFIVNGSDKPYAFVSINRDVVQSGVCSDDVALRAAAGKLIKEALTFHSIDKECVEEAEAKLKQIKIEDWRHDMQAACDGSLCPSCACHACHQ